MTWAWTLQLSPSPKFVLMALADEANDTGFCFPSHRRIAQKCSITERSVRRMIRLLADGHYLIVQQRFNNRARTSNGYQLVVDHPRTNCPGGPGTGGGRIGPCCAGGVDAAVQGPLDSVVRVTTTYPLFDPIPPLPPHPGANQNAADRAVDGGSGGGDLCFPRAVSKAQRQALQALLSKLSRENAQLVLDELAGRMNTTHVRNPIGYCATLVVRIQRGDFTPELGVRVAEQRDAERQRQSLIRDEACAASTSVHPAASALPEGIRSSLERMRQKALSAPTGDERSGVLLSNSAPDEESE
jgi:Helix-turn-helix domain